MILLRTDTAANVYLPDDLYWEDEYISPLQQSIATGLNGSALIQSATRLWLPMTLRPWDDTASWVSKADVDVLSAWAAIPNLQLELIRNSTTHSLFFRYTDGDPVTAKPAFYLVNDTGDATLDPRYLVTLRFIRVN